jgi:hypothetical protein
MIRETSAALRQLITEHFHPSFQAWTSVQNEVGIFDATNGPRAIAKWLIQNKDPIEVLLKRSGFDDPLRAVSGYMRAVQVEVLRLTPRLLASPNSLANAERVFSFLAPSGSLRFPDAEAAGIAARGLLAPWLHGEETAGEEVRLAVQEFLLKHLGDPRLRPQLWQLAGDETVALMRRWLVKVSLKAFFRLIRDHALDSHWTYREAFWDACFKKCFELGTSADAWVILGSQVRASAQTVKELKGAYGKLSGGAANHSVLLMHIGDLVFCEWSHVGALRAWDASSGDTPKLGSIGFYYRDELTKDGLSFPVNERGKGGNKMRNGLSHIGSDTGYWQGSVANLLATRTGATIRLSKRDYMPR